jgi:hypothetical protein
MTERGKLTGYPSLQPPIRRRPRVPAGLGADPGDDAGQGAGDDTVAGTGTILFPCPLPRRRQLIPARGLLITGIAAQHRPGILPASFLGIHLRRRQRRRVRVPAWLRRPLFRVAGCPWPGFPHAVVPRCLLCLRRVNNPLKW